MTSARRLLSTLPLLLSALLWAAPADLPRPEAGKLSVYFFDVGQGDAALIVSPTGKTVLVDGGPPEAAASLADKVSRLTHGPLDLVILTHPHLDHLGGMGRVLKKVGAKRYLDPEFDHPSTSYRNLLEQVAAQQIPVLEATPGEDGAPFQLGIGGGAQLEFYWPRRPADGFLRHTRSDPNANSVVFRLSYGTTAFLFVGDSEAETEDKVLGERVPHHATVLKVAHHGSRYSSQAKFLARVEPRAAVISCGVHNDYGHPSPEAIGRLEAAGARVFRTDLQGDVEAVSDGAAVHLATFGRDGGRADGGSFAGRETGAAAAQQTAPVAVPAVEHAAQRDARVEPARAPGSEPAPAQGYVASRKSKVFHRADCRAAQRISPQNLVHFDDRASASAGRRPARDCNP